MTGQFIDIYPANWGVQFQIQGNLSIDDSREDDFYGANSEGGRFLFRLIQDDESDLPLFGVASLNFFYGEAPEYLPSSRGGDDFSSIDRYTLRTGLGLEYDLDFLEEYVSIVPYARTMLYYSFLTNDEYDSDDGERSTNLRQNKDLNTGQLALHIGVRFFRIVDIFINIEERFDDQGTAVGLGASLGYMW